MDALADLTCTRCPEPCCLRASVYFDLTDLIYLHLNGTRVPDRQLRETAGQTCRYLTTRGCGLERSRRPWACTWYLCPTQTGRLTTEGRRAEVETLLAEAKLCRRALERKFIAAVAGELAGSLLTAQEPIP